MNSFSTRQPSAQRDDVKTGLAWCLAGLLFKNFSITNGQFLRPVSSRIVVLEYSCPLLEKVFFLFTHIFQLHRSQHKIYLTSNLRVKTLTFIVWINSIDSTFWCVSKLCIPIEIEIAIVNANTHS